LVFDVTQLSFSSLKKPPLFLCQAFWTILGQLITLYGRGVGVSLFFFFFPRFVFSGRWFIIYYLLEGWLPMYFVDYPASVIKVSESNRAFLGNKKERKKEKKKVNIVIRYDRVLFFAPICVLMCLRVL
jgi:hypothetical protein